MSFAQFDPVVGSYVAKACIAVLVLVLWLVGLQRLRIRGAAEELAEFCSNLWSATGVYVISTITFSLVGVAASRIGKTQSPWPIEHPVLALGISFLLVDFASYLYHVAAHKTRLLWTLHVVHHSGHHFNLSLGARQSWIERAIVTPLIYTGMLVPFCALFDIAYAYLILGHQLVYLAGFLTHTKSLDYWPGFLRHIFINPIEHRIHHGMAERHFDCNYGFALKTWDLMFRTYRAPDVPAEEILVGVKNQEFTANVFATQAQTLDELAVWAREVGVFPALQSLSAVDHKVEPTSLKNILYGKRMTTNIIQVIPGNPGDAYYYEGFANQLRERGHQVVVFDHARLHSPSGMLPYAQHQADCFRNYLRETNQASANVRLSLVGHSIGGYIAHLIESQNLMPVSRALLLFPFLARPSPPALRALRLWHWLGKPLVGALSSLPVVFQKKLLKHLGLECHMEHLISVINGSDAQSYPAMGSAEYIEVANRVHADYLLADSKLALEGRVSCVFTKNDRWTPQVIGKSLASISHVMEQAVSHSFVLEPESWPIVCDAVETALFESVDKALCPFPS